MAILTWPLLTFTALCIRPQHKLNSSLDSGANSDVNTMTGTSFVIEGKYCLSADDTAAVPATEWHGFKSVEVNLSSSDDLFPYHNLRQEIIKWSSNSISQDVWEFLKTWGQVTWLGDVVGYLRLDLTISSGKKVWWKSIPNCEVGAAPLFADGSRLNASKEAVTMYMNFMRLVNPMYDPKFVIEGKCGLSDSSSNTATSWFEFKNVAVDLMTKEMWDCYPFKKLRKKIIEASLNTITKAVAESWGGEADKYLTLDLVIKGSRWGGETVIWKSYLKLKTKVKGIPGTWRAAPVQLLSQGPTSTADKAKKAVKKYMMNMPLKLTVKTGVDGSAGTYFEPKRHETKNESREERATNPDSNDGNDETKHESSAEISVEPTEPNGSAATLVEPKGGAKGTGAVHVVNPKEERPTNVLTNPDSSHVEPNRGARKNESSAKISVEPEDPDGKDERKTESGAKIPVEQKDPDGSRGHSDLIQDCLKSLIPAWLCSGRKKGP